MGHGQATDLVTPYEEALELQEIYNSLGITTNWLLFTERRSKRGTAAWNAIVDGKGLFEMSFDFLVERQNLNLE